jgi:hypothetical protein
MGADYEANRPFAILPLSPVCRALRQQFAAIKKKHYICIVFFLHMNQLVDTHTSKFRYQNLKDRDA